MQDKSGAGSKPDPKYIYTATAERSRARNAMVYTFPATERGKLFVESLSEWHIYIYIYIYAHNTRTRTRGNFLYSRQITGHASLSREAKRPFETLSPLLSGSSAGSSERPENSPFTFSHLLPPPWIRGGGSSGIDPRYPRIHRTKNLSLSLSLSLPLSLSLSLSPWKQSIERHEKGRKEGRRNGSRFAGLKRWKKTWDRFAFSRTSVSRELFIDSADKEVPRACSPAAGREWTGCARLLNTIVAAESRGL